MRTHTHTHTHTQDASARLAATQSQGVAAPARRLRRTTTPHSRRMLITSANSWSENARIGRSGRARAPSCSRSSATPRRSYDTRSTTAAISAVISVRSPSRAWPAAPTARIAEPPRADDADDTPAWRVADRAPRGPCESVAPQLSTRLCAVCVSAAAARAADDPRRALPPPPSMPHERRRDPAALEARIKRLGWHFAALSHAADAAAELVDPVAVPAGDDRDEATRPCCSCGARR